MSEDMREVQETLEKFGYIVLNRWEPLDAPSTIEIRFDDSEEWSKVRVTERATIQEWVAQCNKDKDTISVENLGPYFYKVVAE